MIILFWFHDYNLKMASWQKNEEVYSALPNDPSVSYSYCLSSNNCRWFDIEKKNKQNKCDISTLHFKIATPLHIYLKIFSLALQEFGFQNLVQQKRLIHNKICYYHSHLNESQTNSNTANDEDIVFDKGLKLC